MTQYQQALLLHYLVTGSVSFPRGDLQRKQEAIDYKEYLATIVDLTRKVSNPGAQSSYPQSIRSASLRALFDNMDGPADVPVSEGSESSASWRQAKALALDHAIRSVKKADWRGNKLKEREVRNAIKSELGDDEGLVVSFARQTNGADAAAKRITLAYHDILDGADGQPLAIATSPARLTPFGEAASNAGLSPATARRLRRKLGDFSDQSSSRADLITISVELLKSLANVAEQGDPDLRKAVENPRSRPVVRLNEIEIVLDRWLAGESIETIFAALPANQRSQRRPGLQTWLQGVAEDSTWTDEFAKFYDFMNNCVEFFLPWVLRAAQPLTEIDMQPERPWGEWARFVELGVDSTWGARLIEGGPIVERAIAGQIGRQLEELTLTTKPTIEQVQQVLFETLRSDDQAVTQVLDWYRQWEI